MAKKSIRNNCSRLLKGFLILFVIALFVSPMHAQAASNKQKAYNAYKTILSNPAAHFEYYRCGCPIKFALAYVDNNKIPELFVQMDYEDTGFYSAERQVYTWKNGKVKLIDKNFYSTNIEEGIDSRSSFAGYYKKTGVYVWRSSVDVGKVEVIRKIKSGKLKKLASKVDPSYIGKSIWKKGKKRISKQAYKNYVRKVSKKKKLKKFKWVTNTAANRNRVFGNTRTTKKVTQYRYADKVYTTSTASSLSGWIRYDSGVSYGSWGNWSSWSTTAQTSSDTKQVQTRTEYRYYCFLCPVCGGREPIQGPSDCRQYNLTLSNAVTAWFPIAYNKCTSYVYSYATYKRYTESLGDGLRWNFSAGNLNSTAVGTKDTDSDAVVIRRAYRYQTRSKSTVYKYYKWGSWSPWSTTRYTATGSRKVETQTITVAA